MRIAYHEFAVGFVNDDRQLAIDPLQDDVIGVLKRDEENYRAPLVLRLENMGSAFFTLNLLHSNDNAVADPYAVVQMRYNAALTNTITLVKGGIAIATIESALKPYLLFRLTAGQGAAGARGTLQVGYFLGSVSARPRIKVP